MQNKRKPAKVCINY